MDETDLPVEGKPEGISFPDGLFSFTITGLTPGETVSVHIELPSPVPIGSQYWKYQEGSGWYSLPIDSDDGDNNIIITLTDGETGDADGTADGIIIDPGGPALVAPRALVGGPYIGVEGSAISFDCSGSNDINGRPLLSRWDFEGDGTWDTEWSSTAIVSYDWVDDWSGYVIVEVSNGLQTDTDTTEVTILNVNPLVDAGDDQTVLKGDIVSFSATFSDPSTLDTHTLEWDFGDGVLEINSLTPTHSYNKVGEFVVSLSVTDDDGGVGSDDLTVIVRPRFSTQIIVLVLVILVLILWFLRGVLVR